MGLALGGVAILILVAIVASTATAKAATAPGAVPTEPLPSPLYPPMTAAPAPKPTAASPGLPAPAPAPTVTINTVFAAQQVLIQLYGPSILPKYGADGKGGTETSKAVTQFQRDWDDQSSKLTKTVPHSGTIKVDGVLGPDTYRALGLACDALHLQLKPSAPKTEAKGKTATQINAELHAIVANLSPVQAADKLAQVWPAIEGNRASEETIRLAVAFAKRAERSPDADVNALGKARADYLWQHFPYTRLYQDNSAAGVGFDLSFLGAVAQQAIQVAATNPKSPAAWLTAARAALTAGKPQTQAVCQAQYLANGGDPAAFSAPPAAVGRSYRGGDAPQDLAAVTSQDVELV